MSAERLAGLGFTAAPSLACMTWTRAMPDGSTIVLTGADERDDPTDDLTGACWVTHLADPSDWATERASLRAPTLDAALDWARARLTLTERAPAMLAKCSWCGAEICDPRPPRDRRGDVFCSQAHRDASSRAVARLLTEGTDR